MIRYLILFLLAYLFYKLIKPVVFKIILGEAAKYQKAPRREKDDFQDKHKDKIEDADFEEIE